MVCAEVELATRESVAVDFTLRMSVNSLPSRCQSLQDADHDENAVVL